MEDEQDSRYGVQNSRALNFIHANIHGLCPQRLSAQAVWYTGSREEVLVLVLQTRAHDATLSGE